MLYYDIYIEVNMGVFMGGFPGSNPPNESFGVKIALKFIKNNMSNVNGNPPRSTPLTFFLATSLKVTSDSSLYT